MEQRYKSVHMQIHTPSQDNCYIGEVHLQMLKNNKSTSPGCERFTVLVSRSIQVFLAEQEHNLSHNHIISSEFRGLL